MNVMSALNEFILDCEAAGRSQHTIRTYRSHVADFARYCRLELELIRRETIRDYMTDVRSRKAYEGAPQKPEQSENLSSHYVASRDRHLRAFFSWCVDVGYLERSPMDGMKQPRPPKLKPKAIQPRQFAMLLQVRVLPGS